MKEGKKLEKYTKEEYLNLITMNQDPDAKALLNQLFDTDEIDEHMDFLDYHVVNGKLMPSLSMVSISKIFYILQSTDIIEYLPSRTQASTLLAFQTYYAIRTLSNMLGIHCPYFNINSDYYPFPHPVEIFEADSPFLLLKSRIFIVSPSLSTYAKYPNYYVFNCAVALRLIWQTEQDIPMTNKQMFIDADAYGIYFLSIVKNIPLKDAAYFVTDYLYPAKKACLKRAKKLAARYSLIYGNKKEEIFSKIRKFWT